MASEMNLRVKTGTHFMDGNAAIAEGAMAAGLTSFYGYPITPSSDIAEILAKRLDDVGRGYSFIQVEDEIAAIIACIGGSWAGGKVLTATSGPGFSLMQEGIGLANVTETPLVIVNSQRGGPSTGLPTHAGQGEVMQTHYGSHGDYLNLVIAPASTQECFDLTIEAFNCAEQLRVPTVILSDQIVSSFYQKLVIPEPEKITIKNRPRSGEVDILDYVSPMTCFGEGKGAFSTGLIHDASGTPKLTPDTQQELVTRLFNKLEKNQHVFPQPEYFYADEDVETLVIAFGSVARMAQETVYKARTKFNAPVGLMRLRTIWPFPIEELKRVTGYDYENVKHVIVAEMNRGQLIWPVSRYASKNVSVHHYEAHLPLNARELWSYIESVRS
ncbi:MAG: thiamine pyrophosphate-binding protein [Candidatus Odinarchaeota archaeon]